jgi:hypothetical protein
MESVRRVVAVGCVRLGVTSVLRHSIWPGAPYMRQAASELMPRVSRSAAETLAAVEVARHRIWEWFDMDLAAAGRLLTRERGGGS